MSIPPGVSVESWVNTGVGLVGKQRELPEKAVGGQNWAGIEALTDFRVSRGEYN